MPSRLQGETPGVGLATDEAPRVEVVVLHLLRHGDGGERSEPTFVRDLAGLTRIDPSLGGDLERIGLPVGILHDLPCAPACRPPSGGNA